MKRFLLIVIIVFLVPISVSGAGLSDTQLADNMAITSQVFDPGLLETTVDEVIADSKIIPYPSHDGFAIVNQWDMFFDSYVDPNPLEIGAGFMVFNFNILNSSNRNWSDFHFEFYDLGFTDLVSVPIIYVETSNFEETNFVDPGLIGYGFYDTINFWASEPEVPPASYVASGEEASFLIVIDLFAMPSLTDGFSIRQIATTTPVPGAIWIMGLGLVGLLGFRRKLQ